MTVLYHQAVHEIPITEILNIPLQFPLIHKLLQPLFSIMAKCLASDPLLPRLLVAQPQSNINRFPLSQQTHSFRAAIAGSELSTVLF